MIKGKLPPALLSELLSAVSRPHPRLLLGPSVGEDAAVIDMGDRVLVVHSDPITGATSSVGWLAVHVACNDIATRGARPLWLLPVLLLPPGSLDAAKRVVADIRRAADEVNATVVGGHTEFTPGLGRPIVVMTAIGEAPRNRYFTTSGCKPGDDIVLTKGVAIEGTSIIASELGDKLADRVPRAVLERAKAFIQKISVVPEALAAAKVEGVHAMHDPTEGGIAGGLQEMALASGLGVEAYEDRMIIAEETRAVLSAVGADPLKTISSGSLLIAVDPRASKELITVLRKEGVEASVIGRFTSEKEKKVVYRSDGSVLNLSEPIEDELWRVLEDVLE